MHRFAVGYKFLFAESAVAAVKLGVGTEFDDILSAVYAYAVIAQGKPRKVDYAQKFFPAYAPADES